jgi:hypothetical protein
MDIETLRLEALQCIEATDKAVLAADVIAGLILASIAKLEGNRIEQQRQLAPLVSQDLLLVVVTRFACECELLYTMTNGA